MTVFAGVPKVYQLWVFDSRSPPGTGADTWQVAGVAVSHPATTFDDTVSQMIFVPLAYTSVVHAIGALDREIRAVPTYGPCRITGACANTAVAQVTIQAASLI